MGELVKFDTLQELSPMGQAALTYAASGFFVFPCWGLMPDLACGCPEHANCGSAGKHPMVKSGLNASTTSADQIRKWWLKWPNANIAINAERSGLLILDVDPRNDGDASLAKLEAENGELPSTYEVKTGGGGRHFYFKHKPVRSKPVASGLDIKSLGGYVVAPPSIHHSGRPYEAFHLGDPRGFILGPPDWLVDLCMADASKKPRKPQAGGQVTKASAVDSGLFGAAFAHAGWLGEHASAPNARCARCPFDAEHTTGAKGTPTSSTVVYAPENGGVNGYVQCSHSHCGHRRQSDFWAAVPEASREYAKHKLKISVLYDPAATSDPGWASSWRADLLFDNKGKLKQVKGNAAVILKNHPDFVGCLGHDTFSGTFHWLRSPPTVPSLGTIPPGPVVDKDFVSVAMYLAKQYDMQDYGDDAVNAIMRAAALPFHPVLQYLDSIGPKWDQQPRMKHWLHTYLGCPDSLYEQAVGSWWLVSAVARIMKPGCKADHVLILEGSQGTRKSTALSVLFNPWFADTPINLDSKDAYMALRGVWGYELQELASLSKADSDKAKSFFSSPRDKFRPPYGRNDVELPRQCVFAGSVNNDAYLKDDTGNRRYWPVRTDRIDIDTLVRDRDQLWAEALFAYNLGHHWEPRSEADHALCQDEQLQRIQWESDPWTSIVRSMTTNRDEVSAPDLANEIQGNRATQADSQRVARILRAEGWLKKHTNKGKVWKKPLQAKHSE